MNYYPQTHNKILLFRNLVVKSGPSEEMVESYVVKGLDPVRFHQNLAPSKLGSRSCNGSVRG